MMDIKIGEAAKLCPQDAYWIEALQKRAYERRACDPVKAGVVSIATNVSVVCFAILSVPLYAVRGVAKLSISLVNLNYLDLREAGNDFKNAGSCLLLTGFSVFLFTLSFFSPRAALAFMAYEQVAPSAPAPNPLVLEINRLGRELETTQEERRQSEKQLLSVRGEQVKSQQDILNLRGQVEELQRVIRGSPTERARAELTRYSSTTRIISFVLNGQIYEIISDTKNQVSVDLSERVIKIVERFQERFPDEVETILGKQEIVVLDSKRVIDFTHVVDPERFPDIRDVAEGASAIGDTNTFFSFVNAALGKENHDPTKLRKYGSWMDVIHHRYGDLLNEKVISEAVVPDPNESGSSMSSAASGKVSPPKWPHEFQTLLRQLQSIIQKQSVAGLFKDPRERYMKFCEVLDKISLVVLEHKEDLSHGICTVINKILVGRWMRVSMDGYLAGLVDHVLAAYRKENRDEDRIFDVEQFGQTLIELNRAIDQAPSDVKKSPWALAIQKFMGEIGGEDYTGRHNLPEIRAFDDWQKGDQESQKIVYVRHGCPTAGDVAGGLSYAFGLATKTNETVVPNYRAFLNALDRRKEAAFITTHQQYIGQEATRVDEVIKLQTAHKNVAVLVQPINQGHLGKKAGPYKDINTYEGLKQAILENFFEGDEGDRKRCQLPQFIREDQSYRKATEELIDFVKAVFFTEQSDFSQVEVWCQFLLIFFVFQRNDLMLRFQEKIGKRVVYKTTFCKDFLDRGGISALTEATIWAAMTDRLGSREWMQEQVTHVLGPPIAVKRIAMLEEDKLDIFEALYPRILDVYRSSEKLGILKAFRFAEKYQLTGHRVEKIEGQKAMPDIGEIPGAEEVREYLRWVQGVGRSPVQVVELPKLLISMPDYFVAGVEKIDVVFDGKENTSIPGVTRNNYLRAFSLIYSQLFKDISEQIEDRLVRKEKGWKLSGNPKVRFVVTTLEKNKVKIELQRERGYRFYAVAVMPDEDAEFQDDTEFAIIREKLVVEFNPVRGQFLKAAVRGWEVVEVINR